MTNHTQKKPKRAVVPRFKWPYLISALVFGQVALTQAQAQETVAELDRTAWSISASNSNNLVNNAIDSNINTRWTTSAPQQSGQYLEIDLNDQYDLSSLLMVTRSAGASENDYPRGFTISLSDDGINFANPIASGSGSDSGTTEVDLGDQSARFVRIEQTGADSFFWWSVHELNILGAKSGDTTVPPEEPPVDEPPSEPNPTASQIPNSQLTVNASLRGGSAALAIDNNLATRWTTGQSQRPGQSFTIDTGQIHDFDRLNLLTKSNSESDEDFPRGFEVQVSDDGTIFSAPVAQGEGSPTGETQVDLTGQSGRYLRIIQTGSDNFFWWSIHELAVFGVQADGNPNPPIPPTPPNNAPPTASFTPPTPSDNAQFISPLDVQVAVQASDSDGSVENVRLFLNDVFVGQENAEPYEWNAQNHPDLAKLETGSYRLRAEATDNLGAITSIISNFLLTDPAPNNSSCEVAGTLRQWHRVELVCSGPRMNEQNEATFTDNRFNVTFSNGSRTIVVPGHFAADGDAADTSASSGDQWRAYFSPPTSGQWNYSVSFRTGTNIAVDLAAQAGTPVAELDGKSGSFTVANSGQVSRDMRTRGLLEHRDNESRLRFAGTGDVFVQGGVDSPENIFGYDEMDNTRKYDNVGSCKGILHSFDPHQADWNQGDPTWGNGRGKSLIGLVNYIAETGANSFYIMMNTVNGDGCDAHPWTEYNSSGDIKSFDVSKLDQWERVLSHMTAKGMLIHVMTQETENDGLLGRSLNLERRLFYRELISRFGHHPALVWNMGEENNTSTPDLKDYAAYLKDLDPYDHPVHVHNHTNQRERKFGSLLGERNFNGPTIQISNINDSGNMYEEIQSWIRRSRDAGNTWVVTLSEASGGGAPGPGDNVTATQRLYWMWASVMSGGGGFEWYLRGQNQGHALDLSVENMRDFDPYWKQSGHLIRFFRDIVQQDANVSLQNMVVSNAAINGNNDWVLADAGQAYIAVLRNGGNAQLNLAAGSNYNLLWFNPRTGQSTPGGTVAHNGNTGQPPSQTNQDWVVLLTASESSIDNELHPDIVRVLDTPLSEILRVPGGDSWADSYSVGDQCFCETTFDHNIGPVEVDTPVGRMTVRQACDRLGRGPGSNGRPKYNDVQCGNGPANDAGDEDWCPGRVDVQGSSDERKLGCNQIGPRWKFN